MKLFVHTERFERHYPESDNDTSGEYRPVTYEAHRLLAYSPETDADYASVSLAQSFFGLLCSICDGDGCDDCTVHECLLADGDNSLEVWALGKHDTAIERENAALFVVTLERQEYDVLGKAKGGPGR